MFLEFFGMGDTTWSVKSLKELLSTRLNSVIIYTIPAAAWPQGRNDSGKRCLSFHSIPIPTEGSALAYKQRPAAGLAQTWLWAGLGDQEDAISGPQVALSLVERTGHPRRVLLQVA